MTRRILYVVNDVQFFISHRLPIALAAMNEGYQVHVAAPESMRSSELKETGIEFQPISMRRRQTNPIFEGAALVQIIWLLWTVRPDILHLITIKPVLYGTLASYFWPKTAVVAAISGLGPAFRGSLQNRLLSRLVKWLYKIAFLRSNLTVIFQNPDDRQVLLAVTSLNPEKTVLIKGSGVDLAIYRVRPIPSGTPRVLMAGRLLRDKGVFEFIEAARIILREGVDAEFWLAGSPDEGSPGAITQEELAGWEQEGTIKYLGHRSDMPDLISETSIVVLPSIYGEGLPKILVEAAACGRPVITTDHPGCRDAIIPEETGLLVPPKDVDALSDAIKKLLTREDLRLEFGRMGRNLAKVEFSIRKIVNSHIDLYDQICK